MSAAAYTVAKEDNLEADTLAAGGEDLATMTQVLHLDEGVPLVPAIIASREAAWAAGTAAIAWMESEERAAAGEVNVDTPAEGRVHAGGGVLARLVGLDPGTGDVIRARDAVREAEGHGQARLVTEIFNNPFRAVSLDPAWRTPTVADLAAAAYEERSLPSGQLDPARLAVLADALEEAGCTNAEILGHLRSAGPHVRGCWCVDLVLAKE
jgi:hypothetical protein